MNAAFLALMLAADPAPDLSRGRAVVDAYFRDQVKRIDAACLTDLTTKEAWEARRPELRRQFLEMMGLWPLPPKTDLKATVTGRTKGDGFVVERLHFQSRPGLYVTANLYLPAAGGTKLPTVLYVCGHGTVVENGVPYGSKVSYQYHPAWFAAHGYACLVLDTLQLSEIPALHHGTYREKMWWWHARGYTPGGVELWNAIRALDYLQTRPEVDPERLAVTGRSGGGATSWWVAAADDRVKVVAPIAGIADLKAQVCEGEVERLKAGVIAGHCDCMFPVNTYRWDFAQIVALVAPRPLLLGNSDADDIFPVAGYRRIADKVNKVYALYGANERFQLLETKGPHKDTPELRVGINRWMNRWLKGDSTTPVEDDLPPKLPPAELKVLAKTPDDAINTSIQETFIKPASVVLPESPAVAKEWWANRRPELMVALKTKVFAGWPAEPPRDAPVLACDTVRDGVRFRAIDFTSETAVPLRLFVVSSPTVAPQKVVLSVLDEAGWKTWCRDLGSGFAEFLQQTTKPEPRDDAKFAQNRKATADEKVAFAAIAPRGIGPTKWAEDGSTDDTQIRRRFPLVGQTLDGQRVWDVRRAVAVLQSLQDVKSVPLTLHGEREAAGVALYAGLFEPTVAGFDLWHLPPTHRDAPTFLNVLTVLDVPQAVALAAPRPVTLWVKADADAAAWAWPLKLQQQTGVGRLKVRTE